MAGMFDDLIPQQGDKKSALTFEDLILDRRPELPYGQPPEGMVYNPDTGQMEDLRSSVNPKIPQGGANATALGYGQGLGFGLLDEATAGLSAVTGGDYNYDLARMREAERRASEDHPWKYYGGQLAGGVSTGAGMSAGGLSLGTNAIARGSSLGRVAGASAIDGLLMGSLTGFGSGEGVAGRVGGAVTGALLGGGLGGVVPLGLAGAGKFAQTVFAPLLARVNPEKYANAALTKATQRAGRTPDQIADIMQGAVEDGQKGYAVLDALGHTGQRVASSIARTPHDMRQGMVDFFRRRQSGASDRLGNAIAEGFDAFDTSAARGTAMTKARDEAANVFYTAARKDAGPVDITKALEKIDETLSPGLSDIFNPRDKIANDTIEGALARVRSMISDGRSNLTDFDAIFRAKLDIDDMIKRAEGQGAGNRAHYLTEVKNQIDDALADASPTYTKARDAFAKASKEIEAIDVGSSATRPSHRASDNISAFNAMTPEQQAAHRVGYADQLLSRVESASLSPTTNKARALQTPKFEEEFQAFAVPGKAEQLGRRIGREQRMFDSANAALGGSKTADNLADAADFAQYDPSIITALATGNVRGAVMNGIGRVASELKGAPPSVAQRIAQAMMETDPEIARQILTNGAKNLPGNDRLRAFIGSMITAGGASAAGRL